MQLSSLNEDCWFETFWAIVICNKFVDLSKLFFDFSKISDTKEKLQIKTWLCSRLI